MVRAVLVLALAADVGLIDFDDTHQLAEVLILQSSADAMAHVPSRPVRAETHVMIDLERAHPLLAGQHQVNDAEPLAERLIRVLKNRVDQDREPIAVGGAGMALPMEGTARQLVHFGIAAARAMDARRPAMPNQVSLTGVLIWELPLEVCDGHLLGALAGHDTKPLNCLPNIPMHREGFCQVRHNRPILSCPRKRASRASDRALAPWIPACAGMTGEEWSQ